jgi:hypothetical protein
MSQLDPFFNSLMTASTPNLKMQSTINACLLEMIADRWKKYENLKTNYRDTSFTFDVVRAEIDLILEIFAKFNPDYKPKEVVDEVVN